MLDARRSLPLGGAFSLIACVSLAPSACTLDDRECTRDRDCARDEQCDHGACVADGGEGEGEGEPPTDLVIASDVGTPICLTADESFVFVCDNAELKRFPLDGGEPTVLWDASPYNIFKVARAGGRVLASTHTALHSVEIDGTGGLDLLLGENLHLGLAATDERAYAVERTTITSVPLAGGTPRVQRFDDPTGVLVAGEKLWVIEGDSGSDNYVFHIQGLDQSLIEGAFAIGTSLPSWKPELMVASSSSVFLGSEARPGTEVGIRKYPAQPLVGTTSISREDLPDIPDYTLNGMAADDEGLFVSTDAGVYWFNDSGAFERVLDAVQGPIALTAQYIIWSDGSSLQRSVRPDLP